MHQLHHFCGVYTLKKSLGQHFLHDENIIQQILDQLNRCSFTNLLEIGPGGGALTKHLVQLGGIQFKAVELDDEKVQYLIKTIPGLKEKLIHRNFLEMDVPFDEPFAIIGNFPYNISTEILFRIIEWRQLVTCTIGMFQKEVAQRIASGEGSRVYGVTSVLTQAFFDVNYLFDVPQQAFHPPPKVVSAVIRMEPKIDPPAISSERRLFVLVKTAFNQRRKTLRNAVKSLFDEETLKDPLFNKRAEQLSIHEFASLTFRMK